MAFEMSNGPGVFAATTKELIKLSVRCFNET